MNTVVTTKSTVTTSAPERAQPAFFGMVQIVTDSGSAGSEAKAGLDRVRFGYKLKNDKFSAKFQTEFQKSDASRVLNESEMIFDAEFIYSYKPELKIKVGSMVVPTTMDFHNPIPKIDIVKRGIDTNLSLNRSLGTMIYGSWNGIGYNFFAGEGAERSKAVSAGTAGEDHSYATRFTYDMDKLHLALSYGSSENAGADGGTYHVLSGGAIYKSEKMTFKLDYTLGTTIYGTEGTDQSVWFAHFGYKLCEKFEAVVRHYQTVSQINSTADLSLGNTFIGANFFFNDNFLARLNYILVSGDKEDWASQSRGVGGHFTDNIVFLMTQYRFW